MISLVLWGGFKGGCAISDAVSLNYSVELRIGAVNSEPKVKREMIIMILDLCEKWGELKL